MLVWQLTLYLQVKLTLYAPWKSRQRLRWLVGVFGLFPNFVLESGELMG